METYQGWTNSKTWCVNLYMQQESEIYNNLSAIRKERLLTVNDIKRQWNTEKHEAIEKWCQGDINWQEIADFWNYELAKYVYKVSFIGRKKNAIGIRYQIEDWFKANNENELNIAMYEEYEHISNVKILEKKG